MNISKSQGLYSSFAKKASEHNSGLLSIGLVSIDIPQHPIALHTMVVSQLKEAFVHSPGVHQDTNKNKVNNCIYLA